jgi:pyruvate,water dikinase
VAGVGRVRAKYSSFQELLALNNESLELMARLQEDLQYALPHREVLGDRVPTIFTMIGGVVAALQRLTGVPDGSRAAALDAQQHEIARYSAALEELARPRLSAWLSEVNARSEDDVGSKAAMFGEIRNRLGLPVPDGFVLTTEAYRRYCGIPIWAEIRDAIRNLDLKDLEAVQRVSEALTRKAMDCPLPRAAEVAIAGRTETLLKNGGTLAVRSSAKGEGGERSCAGQYISLLNVLVLDLGGGLAPEIADKRSVTPPQIVSRPFQALWSGITHPGVSWTRQMPSSFSDLASVLGSALGPQEGMRPLGEKSYLLVAGEYT